MGERGIPPRRIRSSFGRCCRGFELRSIPPYAPWLNRIEGAFSILQADDRSTGRIAEAFSTQCHARVDVVFLPQVRLLQKRTLPRGINKSVHLKKSQSKGCAGVYTSESRGREELVERSGNRKARSADRARRAPRVRHRRPPALVRSVSGT